MTEVARRPRAPDGLWWLYLLLAASLAAVGAAAGQVTVVINDLRDFATVRNCLLNYGVPIDSLWSPDARTESALSVCATGFQVTTGTSMVIGAVLVLLLAWLLMLGGGLAMRVRLRRRGAVSYRSAALDAVRERFEHWCDVALLVGRRRPVLLLGRPGRLSRQAYCIAVPLSRPIVVIPAGYAYRDADELDLVVLHELAHVGAGDISWAAAAWWAGWLNVPVLLVVLGLLLRHPGYLTGTFGSTLAPGLASALVLSLAAMMLRAALLRHREQAADRYALAVTGRPEVLRTALGTRPVDAGGFGSWLRGWTAGHPTPDARLTGATMPAGAAEAWRGGFVLAAAASVVALFFYQALLTVLNDLLFLHAGDNRPPADTALAIAALLWAAVLVPAWARYSAVGAWRGWWPPVAGSTAGLLAGYYLWSPGSPIPMGLTVFGGDLLPVAAGWTAAVALGGTLFAVGLAMPLGSVLAAGRGATARHAALAAAVLGAAAVLTTGLTVSANLLAVSQVGADAAVLRAMLPGYSAVSWYRWMPPLILLVTAAVALVSRPAGLRPSLSSGRQGLIVVVVAAATAAAVGITLSQLRTGSLQTADGRYLLVAQRWWICALAGWVTTVALLVAHRPASVATGTHRAGRGYPPTLPTALLAGAAAAALAGAALYARDVLADRAGRIVHDLLSSVRHAVWLELVLIVLSLPVLVAGWRLTARRGGTGPSRSWRLVAGAGAASAVLGTAVATGLVHPVTIAPGDYNSLVRWGDTVTAPPSPFPTATPSPSGSAPDGADPSRLLDAATAGTILDAVGRVLPAGWAPAVNNKTVGTGIQPDTCRDQFARDDTAEQARPKAAEETRTYQVQKEQLPPFGAALVVSLASYRSLQDAVHSFVVPATDIAICPQWSSDLAQADDKRLYTSVTTQPPPTLPYPSYQAIIDDTYRQNSTTGRATSVRLWVLVGHNVFEADAVYFYLDAAMPADRQTFLHDLTAAAISQIITSLK